MTAPAPAAPDLPFRPTVGEALHHAVAHWPDHDFVVTPDRHMTYARGGGGVRPPRPPHARGGDGQGHARRPVLPVRPGVGRRVAGGEPHRRAGDAARHDVPAGRDPQGAAHRRHRHAAHGARGARSRHAGMLEASVPGLADAAGPRALPPRDAVAARGVADRRHRPRLGDAARPGRARRRRRLRRPAARGRGRGGARRPRAGHVHLGLERRSQGCRAHARHRRARHRRVRPRCRPPTARRRASSARSRSSGSAARSSSAPRCRRARPCSSPSASIPAPHSTSSRPSRRRT